MRTVLMNGAAVSAMALFFAAADAAAHTRTVSIGNENKIVYLGRDGLNYVTH